MVATPQGCHEEKYKNFTENINMSVVNSKKHSNMQIKNGGREAAFAYQVGSTSFTDNRYPNSGPIYKINILGKLRISLL